VIKMRREQRTFGDGLIEDEVKGLSEESAVRNMNQCSSIGLAIPANPRGEE
jgi:hypothetical protein